MEQALPANHTFLQSFIDNSLDVIQVFEPLRDPSGQIIDFIWLMQNKRGLAQNGEVIGQSLLEQNPGVVETGILGWMIEVAQTGEPQEHELYYPHEQFEGWFYQAIVKTGDHLLMTTRDITSQKKADREVLRLQQEIAKRATDKYLSLFNHMDQGFCLIELLFDSDNKPIDYRFLDINPVFEKQTGLKEAKGKTARELVPHLEAHWFELYGNVALSGESIHFEQGSVQMGRWFEVYAFRWGEAESHTVALLFSDISRRKAAEDALKESEGQLRFAIEATELGIWDYNPLAGTFTGNTRLKEWFGLTPESEIALSQALEVVQESEREKVKKAIKAALHYDSKGFYDIEYTIVHPLTRQPRIVRAKGRAWFGEDKIAYRFNGSLQDITGQVKALKTVEESEKNLRNTITHAPIAMCIFRGPAHRVEIANERMCEFWGKSAGQVVGKPIFEGLPEVKGQGFEALLDKVYASGETYKAYEVPVRLPRKNAIELVYVNFVYEAFREADGSISGIMAIAIEVTEQVLARQKVEESEQRVRSLVASAPFPIGVYVGKEMQIQLANQSILEVWGKGNDVIGKRYAQVLPELENQYIFTQLDGVFTTGVPFHAYNQRVDLVVEGKLKAFYFNYSFTPLYDGEGKVYGVMNTAANVTDLALAKQKVEEGNRRLQLLTESIPQIVWSASAEGNLNFFSRQWEAYSGMSDEQSLGQGWTEAIHADDLPALSARWSHSLTTGEPYGVEARVRRFDGKYRWMLIRALPLISEQEGILQWMGTCTDLQEYKEAEENLQAITEELAASNEELAAANEEILVTNEELAAANKQLMHTNVDLDNFIYTASHDLKAPISNIEALLQALLRSLSPQSIASERVQHITSLMRDSVERFKRTIANLTEVVKLQKENSEEIASVDLLQIIEEVRLDLGSLFQETKAQLEIKVDSCPQVRFSAKNLRSVIYNLLSNAVKYRFPDRVPHVLISCQNMIGYQVLTVQDNGLGIERERLSQLFTMFKRFHDHVEGTGIGLYMVKRMVDNAGGKIEVESELGVGSTFRIYFKQ